MKDRSQTLATEGVRFFGEISASVSHELKNVLAIVNENAGLLEDMARMVEQGMPLSPERFIAMARSVARQVERGDRIIKNMNRFAHSADKARETVDVGDLVQFMVRLTDRRIRTKGNPPQIDLPASPAIVETNCFYLESLVWSCLDRSLDACARDETVTIRVDRTEENAIRIGFSGGAAGLSAAAEPFPSPREKTVADMLDARLTLNEQTGHIGLILP
ncbi:MAG: hypothetical protein CR984_07695 [Proteobacteria bacterium]|nr:MAG: hypothetical protein CR984_07695 [Pseudomonadota bacterium]